MGFISRLVRYLFWFLILSWVVKLVARTFGRQEPGAGNPRQGEAILQGKRLVRDPVCGMHMAEELALPMSANGENHYFCSEECRQKYETSVLRRAANG